MKADLSIEAADPARVAAAVGPSLRDSDAVRFDVSADDTVDIAVETGKMGALRGATNTALMLTALSRNIMEDR